MGKMLPVDEREPTHKPAVVCAICGATDQLTFDGEVFRCRGFHTGIIKRPIPFKDIFGRRAQ